MQNIISCSASIFKNEVFILSPCQRQGLLFFKKEGLAPLPLARGPKGTSLAKGKGWFLPLPLAREGVNPSPACGSSP
jgi:hypothetical protein